MGFFYGKYFSRKDPNIIGAIIPMVVYVICAILIVLQPDLGSAAIYAGIVGAIFLSLPFKEKYMKYVKYGSLVVVFIALYILLFHSSGLTHTQESRLNYKAPCSRYTQETGYQVCNGFIAIKNGGLFGVGLGNSTQKYMYLPEAHTDFIFPIVCEELGGSVGILIVLLYALLLYFIGKESKKCTNIQGSVICVGVFSYILIHVLIQDSFLIH